VAKGPIPVETAGQAGRLGRDEDLYLDGDATYAEIQRLGDEQGERLALSKSQLGKHLNTIGAVTEQ